MSEVLGGSDFDDLDRGILHALQIDARAPFRRIGEVLGVSDQTIARRYTRLRDCRALRVMGLSDPAVVDEQQWLFHLRVAPEGASEIADGLAARPDTSWIARCGGGALIVGTVYGAGAEPLLLDTLPRARQVLDVQADRVLRIFYGGAGEPYSKPGPLSEEQVNALAWHVPEPATGPSAPRATTSAAVPDPVDAVDRRILAVLRGDGRATIDQLVEATGSSTSTVRRRLQHLRSSGVLRFDVDVDPLLQQLTVRTLLFARIAPAELGRAGGQVAGHDEVGFAAATTGTSNLFLSVSTTDLAGLYDYLTVRLGELPGLQSSSATPVLRTVKAATTRYSALPGSGNRPAHSVNSRPAGRAR